MPKIPNLIATRLSRLRVETIWYFLIAAAIVVWANLQGIHTPHIELSLITPKAEAIQLFCDAGTGFREEISISVATVGKRQTGTPFKIPVHANCERIRLDLGSSASVVTLLSATLHSANGLTINIIEYIKKGQMHEVDFNTDANIGGLTLAARGNDPYVVLLGSFAALTDFDLSANAVKSLCLFLVVVGYLGFVAHIRRTDYLLFSILLIGILLRFLYYADMPLPIDVGALRTVWPDESTYFQYVSTLLQNGLTQYFNNPASIEAAPGNILYLASLMSLFGGDLNIIRVFNLVVLSSLLITFTFKIANNLFNYGAAIGAAALVAVYPELIVFSATLLTEYVFTALLLMFIYVVLRLSNQIKLYRLYTLVGIGTLIGIYASITRLVFLPIILLLAGYAIYRYFQKKEIKTPIALICLGVLIVLGLSPFFLNGYKHSGHYMLATGSGAALWLGSRKETEGDEPPYRRKGYDTQLITHGASHISLEGDRLLRKAGLQNIAADPYNYVLLSIKKVGRLLIGNNYFWFFPHQSFLEWQHGKTVYIKFEKILSLMIATLVTVFGFCYLLIHQKTNISSAFVFISMLTLAATYLPFLVTQRYGLPIFVLNSIFASYVISYMTKEKMTFSLFSILTVGLFIIGFIVLGV